MLLPCSPPPLPAVQLQINQDLRRDRELPGSIDANTVHGSHESAAIEIACFFKSEEIPGYYHALVIAPLHAM